MAQVVVTIAGRTYRMNCADGEEAQLERLAAEIDAKMAELRGHFGEIGEQRLTMMTALTYADDAQDIAKKLAQSDARIADLQREIDTLQSGERARAKAIGQALDAVAARIERVTGELEQKSGSAAEI